MIGQIRCFALRCYAASTQYTVRHRRTSAKLGTGLANHSGMKAVIISGSTRTGSLNSALAQRIAAVMDGKDIEAEVVDLRDHPLPMYNADFQAEKGIPGEAVTLHGILMDADLVVLVSPEYNGGMPPILKNAIDWVSRVTKRPFENKPFGLASASPGQRGGAGAVRALQLVLTHMRAHHAEATFSLGNARERLPDDPILDGELADFVDALVTHVVATPSMIDDR